MIQKRSIECFFVNSANFTCLPGKKDVMKVGKEEMQKYICNDNIALLHKKYNPEHMSNQVRDTTFKWYHPKNVLSCLAKGVSVYARYIETSTFILHLLNHSVYHRVQHIFSNCIKPKNHLSLN